MMSYFTTHLSFNLLVKEFFLKWWTSGEVTGKMVIVSCAPFSLHVCPQRCWSRQISWIIWYYGQKVFLIVVMRIGRLMWVYYQQTSNCCRPVLTYWPTDWRHQWLLIMYSILLRQLFFVAAVVYSGSWDFLYGRSCRCKQLFVSELNNAYFSRHYFILKQCLSG